MVLENLLDQIPSTAIKASIEPPSDEIRKIVEACFGKDPEVVKVLTDRIRLNESLGINELNTTDQELDDVDKAIGFIKREFTNGRQPEEDSAKWY